MYLLYTDESGDLMSPESSHIVVAGIAVHETQVRNVNRAIQSTISRHLDPHLATIEIHAGPMNKGRGSWRSIPRPAREELFAGLLDSLVGLHRDVPDLIAMFGVVREPGAVPGADPLDRVFEELIPRFHRMIMERGRGEYGMIVCDEAKYEKVIQPTVTRWREEGTRFGRLTRIVEVPLFVDSAASRLIQIADVVAYAIYQAYEHGRQDFLERLLPAFRADDAGVLHGLIHLTKDHPTCPCRPCSSRRPIQDPLALEDPETGQPFVEPGETV